MAKIRILLAFLAFLLALCLATSADARRWRWWHSYGGWDRSERAERSGDDTSRRARAAEFPDPAARGPRGAFGTIVNRLISGRRTWTNWNHTCATRSPLCRPKVFPRMRPF